MEGWCWIIWRSCRIGKKRIHSREPRWLEVHLRLRSVGVVVHAWMTGEWEGIIRWHRPRVRWWSCRGSRRWRAFIHRIHVGIQTTDFWKRRDGLVDESKEIRRDKPLLNSALDAEIEECLFAERQGGGTMCNGCSSARVNAKEGDQVQTFRLDLTCRWSRSRIGQTTLTGEVPIDTRWCQETRTSCRCRLRRSIYRTWE